MRIVNFTLRINCLSKLLQNRRHIARSINVPRQFGSFTLPPISKIFRYASITVERVMFLLRDLVHSSASSPQAVKIHDEQISVQIVATGNIFLQNFMFSTVYILSRCSWKDHMHLFFNQSSSAALNGPRHSQLFISYMLSCTVYQSDSSVSNTDISLSIAVSEHDVI